MPEQLQQIQEMADSVTQSLPIWVDFMAAMLGFWGIIMWLFGRKLVKASLTVTGMIVGAAGLGLVLKTQFPAVPALIWFIAGALVGAIIFFMMMRFWIAVMLALIVALLAPVGFAAWQGTAADTAQSLKQASEELMHDTAEVIATEAKDAVSNDEEVDQDSVITQLQTALSKFIDSVKQWWWSMGGASRWAIMGLAGIGAIAGLIIGLIAPNTTASLVSAFVGSALLLFAITHLADRYLTSLANYIPSSVRGLMVILAVMTLLGTGIQWITNRKTADKKSD